jgi:hypothetical protein
VKRALVGIAVLAVAAALLVSPPSPTLASWTDTENSTGSFSAYTVPPPTITGCTSSNVLGSGNITIKWKYNSTLPTPSSTFWFSTSSVITLALLPGSTTTTGPVAGEYTTSFSSGLLAGLLGGPAYVGVAANQFGWGSRIASATATLPAVIGPGSCAIAP